MKKNLFVFFLCLAVMALWAVWCPAVTPIVPAQPTTVYSATVTASTDKVYDAFVKYFADKGFTLETADRAAGKITTVKTQITDKEIVTYFRKVVPDTSGWRDKGMNFGYCDCGLAPIAPKLAWKNLYYTYAVDIKKVNSTTTQFTVRTRFWTELYKLRAFAVLEYDSDWDCASTGEYEKKLIEEIKTNYLKK
jgi:hypothetical protein